MFHPWNRRLPCFPGRKKHYLTQGDSMTVPVCRNRILPLSLKAEANDAYLPSAHPASGDTVVLSEGIAETAASFCSGGMRSIAGICRLCSQVPETAPRNLKITQPAGFSGDRNTTLFCKNAVRKDSATKRRRLPLTGISGKRILTAIQAQRTCRDIPARRSGVITEPF